MHIYQNQSVKLLYLGFSFACVSACMFHKRRHTCVSTHTHEGPRLTDDPFDHTPAYILRQDLLHDTRA